MDKVWIVAADSSRARIFSAESQQELHEIEVLSHSESRLQEQQLQADQPGRTFDSRGDGRHAYVQETDPKKNEANKFAHQVSDYLNEANKKNRFDRMVIIAAPAFLGQLREVLPKGVAQKVSESVAKNVTTMSPEQIREHLPFRI